MKIRSQDIGASVKRYDIAQLQGGVLYVETTGDDNADGKAISRAKLTVQAAVTAADNWSTIFVGIGTFTENITIPAAKTGLTIRGVSQFASIISGASDPTGVINKVFNVYAPHVTLTDLEIESYGNVAGEDTGISVYVQATAEFTTIQDCVISTRATSTLSLSRGIWTLAGTDWLRVLRCRFLDPNMFTGCSAVGSDGEITDCFFQMGAASQTLYVNGDRYLIHGNTIRDGTYGLWLDAGADRNSVFWNNLIDNAGVGGFNAQDDGTNNHWFENFYSDHAAADIDNDGIRNTAYAISGAAGNFDYQGLTFRDGWYQQSLGMH